MSDEQKETKSCPYCGENILAVAIKCKHCGGKLKVPTFLGSSIKGILAVIAVFLLVPGVVSFYSAHEDAKRVARIRSGQERTMMGDKELKKLEEEVLFHKKLRWYLLIGGGASLAGAFYYYHRENLLKNKHDKQP